MRLLCQHHQELDRITAAWRRTGALCRYRWSGTTRDGPSRGLEEKGGVDRQARHKAIELFEELASGTTLDRVAADQVIPFAALAEGESQFIIPAVNDHVLTSVWLAETLLATQVRIDGQRLVIHGIGFRQSPNVDCQG